MDIQQDWSAIAPLERHHDALRGLVTLLVTDGGEVVHEEWKQMRAYLPARTIDSHVRAAELKVHWSALARAS